MTPYMNFCTKQIRKACNLSNLQSFGIESERGISLKQESPPAWTQEAYRPPCSEYSFCCPTWVPPRGGGGYLTGVPPRVPRSPRGGTWLGYPPGGTWPRYPPGGVPGPPQGGTWPGTPGGVPGPPRGCTWPGYPPGGVPDRPPPPLPHGILGNVAKHYGIWVPPPVDRQIDGWTDACQNITFPRTTYAGGKYVQNGNCYILRTSNSRTKVHSSHSTGHIVVCFALPVLCKFWI